MKTGATLCLALLVAIVLSTLADVPSAVADPTGFSFNLIGPNITKSLTAGETIEMTGSGSFNFKDPIVASGSFVISKSATGVVVARGTWSATAFNGFVSFGGPRPGTQGGTLMMIVTLFSDGGAPLLVGQLMTVNCRVFAPPGTGPEGVTIGNFTTITHGLSVFHLNG